MSDAVPHADVSVGVTDVNTEPIPQNCLNHGMRNFARQFAEISHAIFAPSSFFGFSSTLFFGILKVGFSN